MAVDGRPATMLAQAGVGVVKRGAAGAGARGRLGRMECAPLIAGPLAAVEADALASTLKALADPARLRLLSLIRAQPGAEACVCHLVEPLGLTQPTVSYHLKVLLDSGLVQRERRGSWAYYRVDEATLGRLRDLLG